MSSTNVHSNKEQANLYCVCGQTIAKENGEIEIPPKTAQKGPSTMTVEKGLGMEIEVYNSKLQENGILISESGSEINFGKNAFKELAQKHEKRIAKVSKEVGR